VANTDPNPLVSGQSIEKLRAAGVEVIVGVLEAEGQWLNRVFFHSILEKHPYVILKWAESADGFIGRVGERVAISSAATQRLVHRWRSETDAIWVGNTTALVDNPRLDTRFWAGGRQPLRIVWDTKGKIPLAYHLLGDTQSTWVLGPLREGSFQQTTFWEKNGEASITQVLSQLYEHRKMSVLVEGGAAVLQQFLAEGHWNELRIIQNRGLHLGSGIAAPALPSAAVLRESYTLGPDLVRVFRRVDS
jgi:diaminohydroxyphosphoribosylaminopyrimidine deaminase/5-amino-6-(5-phosphoribosylamino)uracil reductase